MTGVGVVGLVFRLTLPFGVYRAFVRPRSCRWVPAVHLPVPLVFLIRFEAGVSRGFLPLTIPALAAGQLAGTRIGHWWITRRRAVVTLWRTGTPPADGGA